MIVIDNENELLKLIEQGVEKALTKMQMSENNISGWEKIESFLGIGRHQIGENNKKNFYGDALQIKGRTVVLNKQALWEHWAHQGKKRQ